MAADEDPVEPGHGLSGVQRGADAADLALADAGDAERPDQVPHPSGADPDHIGQIVAGPGFVAPHLLPILAAHARPPEDVAEWLRRRTE